MAFSEGGTTSPALLHRLVDWRDDAAWREFVERYRPLIESWSRRMRLDAETADELCQRIWVDLSRRLVDFQYDPSRKFRGWLRRLCQSRAVDLLRERQAHPVCRLQDDPLDVMRQGADAADRDEDADAVSARPALLQLGKQVHDVVKLQVEPKTWQAFWSIAIDGSTVRETAGALDMSYAAAFAAHKRVTSRLRAEGRRLLAARVESPVQIAARDEP
jgi:RNA polymerase sigma factor (sigma-70 family)